MYYSRFILITPEPINIPTHSTCVIHRTLVTEGTCIRLISCTSGYYDMYYTEHIINIWNRLDHLNYPYYLYLDGQDDRKEIFTSYYKTESFFSDSELMLTSAAHKKLIATDPLPTKDECLSYVKRIMQDRQIDWEQQLFYKNMHTLRRGLLGK